MIGRLQRSTTMSKGKQEKLEINCCDSTVKPETATFAAGCFWGVEHIFLKHFPPSQDKGVLSTRVGYTGGNQLKTSPTYKQVCSGATNFAEAVKIEFDPSKVAYEQLVGMYISIISHIIHNHSFQNFSIALMNQQR